jgi:hypothetical protein
MGENLAENQQPEGRLDGPGEKFGRVAAQLPKVHRADCQNFQQKRPG